ncbi:MAG TPA: hypothetical protein VJ788_02140 [Gemmatimonadota bacterium]|nr:hypothetical protein [Gemmatimonadota bacterium]
MRIPHLASASLLLVLVACRNGPTGPDPTLVIVEGSTATYQGIDVSLQRFNLSWYPADDSPFPSEGDVFATLLVEITNRSAAPQVIGADQFALRTLSNELALHEGPVWALYDGGRAPRVEGFTVPPREALSGWLTFEVPRGLIAEELLWTPAETLAFALEVRWWLSAVRTDESLLFGYVRDASGSPLPGMRLTITPLETVPGIPGAETTVGDCTGVLHDVLETETDAGGRYEVTVGSIHSGELCIDVHPVGDPLHRVSGFVSPGKPSEVAETPQLRLDLVVAE